MLRKTTLVHALAHFRQQGNQLKTSQALALGISPRTLYTLYEEGQLVQMSRGLYRLAESQPLAQPDLVTVATKIRKGVLCLISALAFHELTTQVPHEIYVALPNHDEKPRLAHPPVRFFWLTEPVYQAGIEVYEMDKVPIKIYSLEKTLADCFKFRRKIGEEVAVEALQQAFREKRVRVEALLRYARLDRVERLLKPYLEVLL